MIMEEDNLLTPEQPQPPVVPSEVEKVQLASQHLRSEIQKVIVGQGPTIDLMFAGILTGGHLLMEGVPGIAKTLMAKLIARCLSVKFARIQFTPDLMPTDVIGTSVYNMKTSEFVFNSGPVFSNIVLIDEINRAPAKTQSALFEAMEERQVTVDGVTYTMEFPFLVIGTQNPIEQEGTYRLPEAQLDRFIFRIKLKYPDLSEEVRILTRFSEDFSMNKIEEVQPVISREQLKEFKGIIEKVKIKEELIHYIAGIIHSTRENADIFLGASPRASMSILRTSKALAAMSGRDFVIPEDIQRVAYPVLNHRIILTPEREMEGMTPEDVIKEIIHQIEVPR